MNIHLKVRPGGRTGQIVAYRYSPQAQRTVTVTLGSISLTADPDALEPDLKLRPGVTLTPSQEVQLAEALRLQGCPKAAGRRAALRQQLIESLRHDTEGDPFAKVVQALNHLSAVLPQLALPFPDPEARWQQLRPRYQACYEAIEAFKAVAKHSGITKTRRQVSSGDGE